MPLQYSRTYYNWVLTITGGLWKATPRISSYVPGASNKEVVDSTLTTLDDILKTLQANLLKAQQEMKTQVDKNRTNMHFDVGDWVYLKLQPYRQLSAQTHTSKALTKILLTI